jgi:hypothetical protein
LFLICQGISSLRLSAYFTKNLVPSEGKLVFALSSPLFAVAEAGMNSGWDHRRRR